MKFLFRSQQHGDVCKMNSKKCLYLDSVMLVNKRMVKDVLECTLYVRISLA